MVEETKKAPQEEDKKPETATPQAEVEPKEEPKKEEKVGDLFKPAEGKPKPEEPRLVPEAVLLEYKKDNKELKKDIKDLKELIESGASKKEVAEDLEKIAEEHGVDIDFLNKLAKSIRSSVEADVVSKIKPIYDKENQAKIDKIFEEHFEKTLEAMPEFKNIANKEVIKKLSLLPENANKTFAKIIEESYGHLLAGKKTLETAKGGSGEEISEIDFPRAKTDIEYYNQIMANPELKKKYNEGLENRINL